MSADLATRLQIAKKTARHFMAGVDKDPSSLASYVTADYHWRGSHPFYEQFGAEAVLSTVLVPLHDSLSAFERRETIFFAGENQHAKDEIWVLSSGTFTGLFDQDFVGIPANRKMVDIPYAEFHHVTPDGISQTALFLDLIRLQQQVGLDPIPSQTGARLTPPGPATNDGVLLGEHPSEEGQMTQALLDQMIADLTVSNAKGQVAFPADILRQTWQENMKWFGPAGIGATMTIPRYQEQHQTPFRTRLADKVFNGHICRIAEGHYSAWFGWPNLNNRNANGFLGLPPSDINAEMRVVDIYRRHGDKLAENWIYIDLLYYVSQHGIDLLKEPEALHHLASPGNAL